MKTSDFPVWLAVPYELRDQARKDAGQLPNGQSAIEWNQDEKLFFARPGCDLDRIATWLPDKSRRAGGGDPQAEFLDVLTQAGLKIKGMPVMNGKRQRVATVEDKAGKQSGVYCGFEDRRPAGWFINYHRAVSDKEVTNWKATGGEADPDTRLHLRAGARQSQDDAERERAKLHTSRTAAAKRLYDRLPPVDADHPYLVRKGIAPTAELRQTNSGSMVVPFFDVSGAFKTLQYIPVTGDKLLYKDAPKQGSFLVVGGSIQKGQPILYAEGYATARSLNEATGHPVVMTIDAGNMLTVSAILHREFPDNPHLFLADFDHTKDVNKGLDTANMAAERVGGVVVHPDFTDAEKALGLTDFNDLHKSRGLDAVRSQVTPTLNNIFEAVKMQDDRIPDEPAVAPESQAAMPAPKENNTSAAPAKARAPRVPKSPAKATTKDDGQEVKKPRSTRNKAQEEQLANSDSSVAAPVLNGTESAAGEPAATSAVDATLPTAELPKVVESVVDQQSSELKVSSSEIPIPLTAVQPGEAGSELTPYERNQLRHHGWTDEQLVDIPADQARSALASYSDNPEPSPEVVNQGQPVIEPEAEEQPHPVEPAPIKVAEDAELPPSVEPDIQQPEAKSDQGETPATQHEVDSIWVGPRRGVDEPQPDSARIDKDLLLSRLDSKLQDDKSVLYTLDGEPAFVDRGMRLEMVDGASQSDEKVLAALLTAAQYYHGRIELTGSDAFQRKAIGLIALYQPNVTMKKPDQQMLLVEARKALQVDPVDKDAIHGDTAPDLTAAAQPPVEPGSPQAANTPSADNASPGTLTVPHARLEPNVPAESNQPAANTTTDQAKSAAQFESIPSPGAGFTKTRPSDIHESPQSASKGVVGKVLGSGDAPFQFDEKNTQSTYITLRTRTGVQTYWGKELAGLLRDTRITPGKVVTLQWLGKEPVTINVPVKDDQGNVKSYERKDTHRNQWSLAVMGGTTVRTGQDEGVKLVAYDANRFAQVQQTILTRLRLDIPLPSTPTDGLYWMTPDGQGSFKSGDGLTAPRPPADNSVAGHPVMSSYSKDGHLDMALFRGDGPFLQGIVRQNGEFQHVLVSLPNRDDSPPMVFNALTPECLAPIGAGNGINASGGQPVSREHIAFKIDGDSATRIGKLDKPAEVPPSLHARLGFDERWRDDNTLPKSAPAAAPTVQPSEPRPA
jgi:putative DNA primase/helicase